MCRFVLEKNSTSKGFDDHIAICTTKENRSSCECWSQTGLWNVILTYGGGTGYMTVAACPVADLALVEDVI
jgi:hypothetical protein